MPEQIAKNSKTWKNLETALAGESQARVKYEYYASQAKKDGYEQVAEIFEKTSHNEKEHAKLWFKYLHDGAVPETRENLKDAAAGENYEWTDMYKTFAEEARAEGYTDLAEKFEMVGAIEKAHEARYNKLTQNIDEDVVFKSEKVTVWKCRNCGYIHVGEEAPKTCPACAHPQAFFEINMENY